MEDLSSVQKLMPDALLAIVFCQSDANFDSKTSMFRKLFIRLVDKALDEYMEARNCLSAQIEEASRSADKIAQTGRYIYMFKFTDNMENCISNYSKDA
jgi:hypothetical protein